MHGYTLWNSYHLANSPLSLFILWPGSITTVLGIGRYNCACCGGVGGVGGCRSLWCGHGSTRNTSPIEWNKSCDITWPPRRRLIYGQNGVLFLCCHGNSPKGIRQSVLEYNLWGSHGNWLQELKKKNLSKRRTKSHSSTCGLVPVTFLQISLPHV